MKKFFTTLYLVLAVIMAGVFLREGYIYFKISELQNAYAKGNFEEILQTSSGTLITNPVYLHNLGNTSYELYNPAEKNIEVLENALEYFKKSLSLGENESTKYNHDIVEELLKQEKQTPQEEKEDSQQAEREQQEDTENSEDEEDSETQETEESQNDVQINQRDEEYKMQESEELGELSPEEQEALEQKIEQLKQEQQFNQNAFNKKPQEGNFGNIFDAFFDTQIGGEEKDW
ncbi:hypothetical protein N9J72_00790 [Candidatus Gracilibacteria bacterium]|nr:hypothetical protein [Candidatus Gracilibacteria bacterium]